MNNNYSFCFPAGEYETLLHLMSKTSVHSSQTSSIPLADFWFPERNAEQQNKLLSCIGIKNYKDAEKIFEMATYAYKTGISGIQIQYSGPSMTDYMIIDGFLRVAIEAKYTEYMKDADYSPSIKDWASDNKQHRLKIINCWRRYIGLEEIDIISGMDDSLPYQFLHRCASACFTCKEENKTPVLLYQLFYDSQTKESMFAFEKKLKTWSKNLDINKHGVKFIISEVEILEDKSPAIRSTKKGDLFLDMITEPQYSFGEVICKNGYDLQII